MAGTGRAPKDPAERRNRTPPSRGEWVDLEPLTKPVLPELPGEEWSPRTRVAWAAWRADPVTSQYSSADVQAAIDLAYVYEQWVDGRAVADEVRQRQDRLGLNPKGKRDLRWRVAEPEEPAKATPKARKKSSARQARLSVVK